MDEHRLGDRAQHFALILLLVAAVFFTMDRFALQTPVGRFLLFEIVAGLFVVISIANRPRLKISKATFYITLSLAAIGIIGFVSIGVLSVKGVPLATGQAIVDSIRYVMFATLVLFVTSVVSKRSGWRLITSGFLISYVLVLIISFGQVLAVFDVSAFTTIFGWENIRGGGTRIAGTFRWQGPLVLFFGATMPLVAATAVSSEGRRALAVGGLYFGGIIALLFTGSRSALLILPFTALPFLPVVRQSRSLQSISAGVTIVGGILIASFATGPIERVFVGSVEMIFDPLSESRVRIWTRALTAMWETSPIAGIGPRQSVEQIGESPHNSFIGITAERGLLGVIPLTVLVAYLCRSAGGIISSLEDGHQPIQLAAASMVPVILVYGITASVFTYRLTPLLIAYVLGTLHLFSVE